MSKLCIAAFTIGLASCSPFRQAAAPPVYTLGIDVRCPYGLAG